MDKFDRILDIHKILSTSKYPVSRREIQKRVECSRATFTRIYEGKTQMMILMLLEQVNVKTKK